MDKTVRKPVPPLSTPREGKTSATYDSEQPVRKGEQPVEAGRKAIYEAGNTRQGKKGPLQERPL